MKSYLDLIPISSKVHRKQTRMTRICIILAVFLITVIFGFADMHLQSLKKQQIQTGGNWHCLFTDIDEEKAALISARPEVSVSGWQTTINTNAGYSFSGQPLSISAQDKSVYNNIFSNEVVEGSYPNTTNEIAVSSKIREMGNIQLGDNMELALPNGDAVRLTVTGFLEDNSRLMPENGMIAVLTPDGLRSLESLAGSSASENEYFVQFSLSCDMQDVISDIMTQLQLSETQVTINASLLGMLGKMDSGYATQIYSVAIVLFFVVMLTGILMISSSLNSNIIQRTEFFGMMRCLGATKKQIMRFVRREGLNWCKTAIPNWCFGWYCSCLDFIRNYESDQS